MKVLLLLIGLVILTLAGPIGWCIIGASIVYIALS